MTDIQAREKQILLHTQRPLGWKGIFDYLDPEDLCAIMRKVTDTMFQSESIMLEFFQ
jgi:hypothetical protein